jgi:hypothetical protein
MGPLWATSRRTMMTPWQEKPRAQPFFGPWSLSSGSFRTPTLPLRFGCASIASAVRQSQCVNASITLQVEFTGPGARHLARSSYRGAWLYVPASRTLHVTRVPVSVHGLYASSWGWRGGEGDEGGGTLTVGLADGLVLHTVGAGSAAPWDGATTIGDPVRASCAPTT